MKNDIVSDSKTEGIFGRAKAVAARFGVSVATVQRWAKAHPNSIHTYHPSDGVTLFKYDEVQQFILSASSQRAA